MQVAVLRDTKPRRRRNRLATILLLPVFVIAWFIGWSLYWAGSRKDREQTKASTKHQEEHITLIPANAIEQENEDLEVRRKTN
jgi:hypothetical protein